jgi:hypothetical protein
MTVTFSPSSAASTRMSRLESPACRNDDRVPPVQRRAVAGAGDIHFLCHEIEVDPLRLKRVRPQDSGGADIGLTKHRRVDVEDALPAEVERRDHRRHHLALSGHAVEAHRFSRAEAELVHQFVRDDGALGPRVDDEPEGPLPVDPDRHRHPRREVAAEIEAVSRRLGGGLGLGRGRLRDRRSAKAQGRHRGRRFPA